MAKRERERESTRQAKEASLKRCKREKALGRLRKLVLRGARERKH